MNDYESRRARKIAQNQALLRELQLHHVSTTLKSESPTTNPIKSAKRRKNAITPRQPARSSTRIAYALADSRATFAFKKASRIHTQLPITAKRTTQHLEELQLRWTI